MGHRLLDPRCESRGSTAERQRRYAAADRGKAERADRIADLRVRLAEPAPDLRAILRDLLDVVASLDDPLPDA